MRIEFPESVKPWRRSAVITGQEVKVLELAAMGYTDSRISNVLGVADDTLVTTWKKILSKISAATRQEAVSKFTDRLALVKKQALKQREKKRRDADGATIGPEQRQQAQKQLLDAITDASLCYINGRQNVRHVYSRMLDDLVHITQSQYGVIGEVHQENGIPFLGEHALTCVAWDDVTQARFEMLHRDHLLFRNLDGLFGETIKLRETIMVNDTEGDSRSGATPTGHPKVESFLGVPVFNGLELVGIIGLANRPNGYSPEMADFLRPIVSTCANITVAWRLEKQRRTMERELDESRCMVRTLTERTPSAVLYENSDRRLEFVNARFGDLFGIEAAPPQLVGIDAALVVKHSARLFADPLRFYDRVEDLINGQESFYGELVEMADGRLFLRDFVVVRSASALCGYFWHYREVMTPFDE